MTPTRRAPQPPIHFLGLAEHPDDRLRWLLGVAAEVKEKPDAYRESLRDVTLGLIFQKPSTRTRVSFEVGMLELGGRGLFLSSQDLQLGRGETISDTSRVLSRYLDGMMARVFAHSDIEELAAAADVPVINGLSDLLHPCQALTDFFTLREEFGDTDGLRLAYVGDGNNVCHSLMLGAPKFGVDMAVATPAGRGPDASILEAARGAATAAGTAMEIGEDPRAAVADADAVYTDTWISMGQEDERAEKLADFQGFRVDAELMEAASPDACFLHCLPAHRGEEVTDEVMDGRWSVVFDQAENRLHVQKALLLFLFDAV